MAITKSQPIGIELARRGIITQSDIDKALEYQKIHPTKKIGDIINILELCDSKKLIDAIGDILEEKTILLEESNVKINISDYISLDIAKKNKVIPFDVQNGKIKVCFADTTNTKSIETIRLLLLNKGLLMDKYITFETNIEQILNSFEGVASENININRDITGIVDSIIKTAMEKRASDIHFEPMEDKLRIRYRIDGQLITAVNIDKEKQLYQTWPDHEDDMTIYLQEDYPCQKV